MVICIVFPENSVGEPGKVIDDTIGSEQLTVFDVKITIDPK